MADKASIQKRFSADPDRYYKVKLFEEQGFTRTACAECGRFFWALDGRKKNAQIIPMTSIRLSVILQLPRDLIIQSHGFRLQIFSKRTVMHKLAGILSYVDGAMTYTLR